MYKRQALTDTDMKYLLLYLEETYGLTSEKKIETAIGIVANEKDVYKRQAWSVSNAERHRACKTAISMTTLLPTTTAKTH